MISIINTWMIVCDQGVPLSVPLHTKAYTASQKLSLEGIYLV